MSSLLPFQLQALLTNSIYLGYRRQYVVPHIFFYLQGHRAGSHLHNLNYTLLALHRSTQLLISIWRGRGCVWCLAPLVTMGRSSTLWFVRFLKRYIYLQDTKWSLGFFNCQPLRFIRFLRSLKILFPKSIVYLRLSGNVDRVFEVSREKIMQSAVVDSNAFMLSRLSTYWVNGNEKTDRSSNFFLMLILTLVLQFRFLEQRAFLNFK